MTHPAPEGSEGLSQPKAESFVDWFNINSRLITIGAIVVGLIGLGYWIVVRTEANATINADKQLLVAKQSLQAGNAPLAETDLKKVYDKYAKKAAGAEAGLLLAQIRLEKGDYPGAVTLLKELSGKASTGPDAAAIAGLTGDALSQLDKHAEAAAEYERASGLTPLTNEKQFWQSKAGRAQLSAGKTAEARTIFNALAAQTDNEGLSTEARVRLGELSVGAGPAVVEKK